MKIIFAGTPDFAVAPLKKLIENGFDIVGVVTQIDKPQGRKGILTPPPVKTAAEALGLTDYFYGTGVCVIEWSENIKSVLPQKVKNVFINKIDDKTREIII